MANEAFTKDSSILDTIRKLMGGEENGSYFDTDLIVAINSEFSVLNQLGVGPSDGFSISDNTATWGDFIGDSNKLNMIISCVQLRVALLFDPPTSGALKEAKESLLSEMEWRSLADVWNSGDNT